MRRDEHGRDVEPLRDRPRVQRPGAAERDQREVARVEAALDRDQPDRVRHVLVGGADRRHGRRLGRAGRARRRARRARRGRRRRRAASRRRGSTPGRAARASGSRRSASARFRPARRRPGPGCAPALRGPTCSRPPVSIHAIEPPPAPIVLTATHGMLTGMPHATWNSRAYCSLPVEDEADVAARAAHVERERRTGCPPPSAKKRAPMTPPASPESSSRAGRAARLLGAQVAAVRREQVPALDAGVRLDDGADAVDVALDQRLDERVGDRRRSPARTRARPARPRARPRPARRAARSRIASAIACSCAGFRYENRHETATTASSSASARSRSTQLRRAPPARAARRRAP